MAIQIGGYNFEGPYTSTAGLRKQSGVYVILGRNGSTNWSVVDVGEAGDVRERVECHDRAPCWKGRGYRELAAAAHYVPEVQRMRIERELRVQYRPPCGDR